MGGEEDIKARLQSPSGLASSASPSDPDPSVAPRHLPTQRGVTPLRGEPFLRGLRPRESLLTQWGGDERSEVGGALQRCPSTAAPPRARPTKKRPTLCSVGRNFYATLQITCTGRPAWSDARNGHRRQPGSSRTEPWRDPGRREPDGCNESRWPGSPDTWTYRQPWRSG